jgi:hypothetical protein
LTEEDEQKALSISKKIIEYLAATSICRTNTTCKFIAFGSKPCGSSWSYLLYSTSIDLEKIKTLVEDYNKKEANFNERWGVASDCAFALPPTSVTCKNNTCVPVY